MVRAGLQALDLPLLVEDKWASPTVTAVKPGFSDIGRFLAALRETGVELAGGQGRLAGQIFRIGHMGSAAPVDMLATLAAIEAQLGGGGKAVSAAEQVWNRARQGKHVGGQGSEGHFI
jgi:aspartate aminotransferase-like enzyme